jgi:glutathione S-transferase
MPIKLFDWAPSPFSLKVRAVLEYKGIAYTRVPALKPANWLEISRRGRIGKVPALDIDGQLFVDSTDIAYELERRFPVPPILPADTRERAVCHAIEEWADESLYFVGLYFQWHDEEGRKMVPQVFGSGLYGRLAYRYYLRRVLGQLRGQGTSRKPVEHVRADLDRHLDRLEALIRPDGYLLGPDPFLCDFAVLGQLAYLRRTPHGARVMAARTVLSGYLDRLKGVGSARQGDTREPAQRSASTVAGEPLRA